MDKLKKEYQEQFNQINISEKEKEEILNKIMSSRSYSQKRFRFAIPICILVLCIVGVGVVYAEEISTAVHSIIISFKKDEHGFDTTEGKFYGRVEINYDAELEEDKAYTFDELEQILGINILRHEGFREDGVEVTGVKTVENKISSASFRIENCYSFKGEFGFVHFGFRFRTKYASQDGSISFSTTVDPDRIETYHINSLDTDATIVYLNDVAFTEKFKHGGEYLIISFIYDNIFYRMDYLKTNFVKQDAYDFLENFKL